MNSRLEKIASYIEDGIGFIDVGTDHGYLPSVMAHLGYKGNIFASDLREGPLNAARQTAKRFALENRIEFILCDGLELCPYEKLDTIVIAGMGGDNICGILDRAEWCMDSRFKLILQPMKKAEILRYWLANNEFVIENEDLVQDSGTVYQMLTARFGGKQELSDAELYTGSYIQLKNNPLFPEMLKTHINRFQHIYEGLLKSDTEQYKAKTALAYSILNELKEMDR